jgi:pyruvate dehydrogenase E2 component (dihydrolipoamide acetyltransferase)
MANVFVTEAEIVEWLVDEGESVVADQPMVTVETDKTQVELPAPVSGVLLHRGAAEGAILPVGSILAVIGQPGEEWTTRSGGVEATRPAPAAPLAPSTVTEPDAAPRHRPLALPLIRKRAREAGVDLGAIRGTGPDGRITRRDLEAHLAGRITGSERPPLVGTLIESAEDLSAPLDGGGRTVRLSPTRRTIADRLSASWREIPHVTTFDAFDAGRLVEARRELSTRLGRRIPLEALMVKCVIPALRTHPEFNATLTGDSLRLHDALHVGVAIDGDDGLLVGVLRDVDTRSIPELATEIERLVEAARLRTLTRADVSGATFTLSNIGAVGGGYGTPIIPLGTTAILSVGRAEEAVVARDGVPTIAPMAPLSLSYDHRVIDGALGRRFLALIRANLGDPALLLR